MSGRVAKSKGFDFATIIPRLNVLPRATGYVKRLRFWINYLPSRQALMANSWVSATTQATTILLFTVGSVGASASFAGTKAAHTK